MLQQAQHTENIILETPLHSVQSFCEVEDGQLLPPSYLETRLEARAKKFCLHWIWTVSRQHSDARCLISGTGKSVTEGLDLQIPDSAEGLASPQEWCFVTRK